MGMSASQIRYCLLVARKTDVEYQGQQINQQRTTLATQSSAYNTQMLTLTVPTPPSTEQYTITSYNFSYNGSECNVKGTNFMTEEYTVAGKKYPAGTYVIDYTMEETQDTGKKGSKYRVSQDANGNYTIVSNNTVHTMTKVDMAGTEIDDKIHQSNVKQIMTNFDKDIDAGAEFYQTRMSDGTYVYLTAQELKTALDESALAQSYYVKADQVTISKKMYGASIVWTETGRMSTITDTNGNVCAMEIQSKTDDAAYNDAYNEYEYQKSEYNKKMDDINAALDIIQAQDKTLELQLQNLDTQENAISNEMDAVKKVVEGNIEKSFSVFG